ncbi:MAG: hypothetical protein JXQ72_00740, partial [Anaerolineae bacterium]|nr:hypothetical protein [Anaerolineae bacterium]
MLPGTTYANPVYRAERLHRQRSKSPRALNVLSVLALAAVLALFTVKHNTGQSRLIVLLALVAIHLLHFITSFLAISFAYESIYREYRNHSWDLLRITPLARGKLTGGKLRAIVGWLAPLYFRLIGLKALFMFWQLAEIHSKAHTVLRGAGPSSRFQDDQFLVLGAAALLFVIAYLLVDLLFTTALGIAAALLVRSQWRRIGLAAGLLARWWLPLLTLAALLTYEIQGFDPLPTQWNTHLSLAARYIWHYGFSYVGYYGAVDEVYPSLTI